jgi:dipeptidase E
MRLFLASQDLGRFARRLLAMMGENRKVLFIDNAKDYYTEEKKAESLLAKQEIFREAGLEDFVVLDLRKYFDKKDELERFVETERPELVFAIGGNSFILRRAFAESGFDEILKRDLAEDKYVYGGSSAGSIVVGPSLRGYETGDDPDCAPEGYDAEAIWDGVGVVEERVMPHADTDWYGEVALRHKAYFEGRGWKYVLLNDADVLVVDGEKKEVLRG